jgi:hypothetical protein
MFAWLKRKTSAPPRPTRPALVIETGSEMFANYDATMDDVADAVDAIAPGSSPCIVFPTGVQIRADGARAKFTIVFREDGQSQPFMVGRPKGGIFRGRLAIEDDIAVVTPLELWSQNDGLLVFEMFFKTGSVSERYVLRDPQVPLSSDDIAALLRGT